MLFLGFQIKLVFDAHLCEEDRWFKSVEVYYIVASDNKGLDFARFLSGGV